MIKSEYSSSEYSENVSEGDQSVYQETSAVTSSFNHPSKDYVNFYRFISSNDDHPE